MVGKKSLYLIVLFLIFYSFVGNSKEYVIGVEKLDYYPHYTVAKGQYGGFARAILDEFAKHKGYTFKYEARPVARLFDDYLKAKKFDFKYPDNAYWQGDMKKGINVVYSEPVAAYIDGVMVTPSNKSKGEANLKNLGTIKGFTAWTYLDSIKAGKIKIRENPGFVPLLKMAIANRIDGAYLNVDVANYQLNNVMKQNGALVFDESLPFTKSNYHLSSVKHPQIIEEFNQFLKQESALISQLKQKFNLSDK